MKFITKPISNPAGTILLTCLPVFNLQMGKKR